MVVTMADNYQRQRAAMSGRRVRRESDARRDLERMHLMTIRREKMRLQEELDRVRFKGQQRGVNNMGKNAKLLSNRFSVASSSNPGEEGASRQRTRLNTASSSPQRMRSPYSQRRTATAGQLGIGERELPQIGQNASPIKGELEMRRHKDEIRDPNTKLNELKKNEGRQKNLLSLKVDMFTRSLSPVSHARSPARSRSHSPVIKPENRLQEIDEVNGFSSEYESRLGKEDFDLDSRASFPPSTRKKLQRMPFVDHDFIDGKQPKPKRLAPLEGQDMDGMGQGTTRADDALPLIPPAQTAPNQVLRRPSIIRRQSQVAILERGDKKNKYATTKDATPTTTSSNNNNSDSKMPKRTVESELNLAVLGRDAKRVKEIIENPEIAFDQEKYAPDGALRTMHMLPDADTAYSQARTARYLRWRDPNEEDKERELTIHEIFAKGKTDY